MISSNMQFTLHWLRNDISPTIDILSFALKGAKQPEKINIITESSQTLF